MKDITEPLSDPITGKPSFVRAMAEEFFNRKPFESLEQWEWEWLRQDLSVAQIEEGLTEAFEWSESVPLSGLPGIGRGSAAGGTRASSVWKTLGRTF